MKKKKLVDPMSKPPKTTKFKAVISEAMQSEDGYRAVAVFKGKDGDYLLQWRWGKKHKAVRLTAGAYLCLFKIMLSMAGKESKI